MVIPFMSKLLKWIKNYQRGNRKSNKRSKETKKSEKTGTATEPESETDGYSDSSFAQPLNYTTIPIQYTEGIFSPLSFFFF